MRTLGRWFLPVVILATSLIAGADVLAYTGGPQMIEVLGWDAHSARVYFHAVYWDEYDHFDHVYHFDLRSAHPDVARVDRASPALDEELTADSLQARTIDSLRVELKPLEPVLAPALPTWARYSERDTTIQDARRVRVFHVDAIFDPAMSVDAVTYQRPEVCARAVYRIPGRQEQVWLIAFRGRPDDPAQVEAARLVLPGVTRVVIRPAADWESLP